MDYIENIPKILINTMGALSSQSIHLYCILKAFEDGGKVENLSQKEIKKLMGVRTTRSIRTYQNELENLDIINVDRTSSTNIYYFPPIDKNAFTKDFKNVLKEKDEIEYRKKIKKEKEFRDMLIDDGIIDPD